MTENHDRIERTLEVLLYAPLGFGLFLKDTAPTFINMFVTRGRAEVDRRHDEVQQRVTTARSLGQVTMAFGPPIVRDRVSRTVADARRRAEALIGSAVPGVVPSASTGPEAATATEAATPMPATESSEPRVERVASVAPVEPVVSPRESA